MFNNYKDTTGYYSRQPSYQDDTNQSPLVPKEGSNQTSAPPWDLSQPHPTYNYCADQHVPARMPALMHRQVVNYDNTPPLYRGYNNTNNQHVLRPKALITCQSNCNRAGCCSKDVPRVPHHWNLCTDKSNEDVTRSTICKGVSQPVSQHISSVETGSRPTGNIDCAVKEFPRFHREIAGSDHLGMSIPQFKNDLTPQQEGSISKQLSVTSENANNPKNDTSLPCQRSCAPNCQQYDHQASKFSLSGQTQLNVPAPSVPNQWLCDSQTRMWSLQNKQPQCLMPLEGVDMTVNNPVASNYWLERTRDKSTVPVPTSKSSYQDMFEYQIQQEQHQKYAQHYQDPDRLKMMERVRYQESVRSSQQRPSDWAQDISRRRNLPPYPVPRYPNVNTSTRPNQPNHDPLVVNPSIPPTYPYTHSKVPLNYTNPTQYSSRFSSTYTQAQSKMVSKSNTSFNPHVHSTHTTNIVPANCIRPTIIQHQPPHFAANVDMNTAQTGKTLQYVSSAQSYNNQPYTSCNEVYKNVNYSQNMQVVDKPCLNTPRIVQPYSVYDKNVDPFYKSIFGQNTATMTRNLMYDKSMPPRQMLYNQSYNTENLQSTSSHQQLDNYMATFHTTRPSQDNLGMQGHAPHNAAFGQPLTSMSQVESETFTLADGSDRPIKKRKPQLTGYEKPLGMDLRQFIETWEEEPEDVPYQPLPDTDSNKVDFRNLGGTGGRPMLEEANADSNVIKLYPTDSDGVQCERNNLGTSVIKPLNKRQQSLEQHTLSPEKEPMLHLKSTGNNEPTNSPSGILQHLLSPSEDGASPIGELLPDKANGMPTPKNVPGSDDMPPGPQSPCGYEQRKPLTDDGSLEQTLRDTKYIKSTVANDDKHDLLTSDKQCVQSELKERWHIPIAEHVTTAQKYVDDINLKSISNENLNRKQSVPEEIRPIIHSDSYSSKNVAPVNNINMVNVEEFEQMLPEYNSKYMPNSHKNELENVPVVDDMGIIKNTSKTDKLSECVDSKVTSSKDVRFTSRKPINPSDSLLLSQNINISYKSLARIKSKPTGNVPKKKNINQNFPKENNVKSLSPQVAKIGIRSASRPRPLSRKRKCLQGKNVMEETTVEDKSSEHLLSSPIETAENTCLSPKMYTNRENFNTESTSKEIDTLESTLTVNRSVDCFAKIMNNGNNPSHEVACSRLHMPSGMSEVLPLPLTKPVAVGSTSTLNPQYADEQLNSEFSSSKFLPNEQWDKKAQDVEVSVTVPDKLLMGNEVVNFNDESTRIQDGSLVIQSSILCTPQPMFGLLEINPIVANKCNEIQNASAAILCGKDADSPVAVNTNSNECDTYSNLHSMSHANLESSPLHLKEPCALPEKISDNLQSVVSPIMSSSSAVAPSLTPLYEVTRPIIEAVKEKSTCEVVEDSKTSLLEPNELPLNPSCSEMCMPNKDSDIARFTESHWSPSTVNLKNTVQLGQSQQENNTGNGSSEIDVNKCLDSLSMINSSNTYDTDMKNQVESTKPVREIQSTALIDNSESSTDAPQRRQSLEKCPNSVIRYISSEVLEENVTHKHPIAEPEWMYHQPIIRANSLSNALEPCVTEERIVGYKSSPIQLIHKDNVSSKIAVKVQEHNAVRDCSKKSKLLSVRIVKKNCNEYSVCSSKIGSITRTGEQSKECSQVQEECSIVEHDPKPPPEKLNENIGLDIRDSCYETDLRPVELSNACDDEVNKYKTKIYALSPGKQIGVTKVSHSLNPNLELADDPIGLTVKLPQHQETQSQPCVSCDESSDDVLDLDASYDFDMETEEESHSTNKESILHCGSKPISIATAHHKHVNLKSNDEEVDGDGNCNILNMGSSCNDSNIVEGHVALPHGDHAKSNSNAAAHIENVRTSSEAISNCDAPLIHPTFHKDMLIAHGATSLPEENGNNYCQPLLEKNTVDVIDTKHIPCNASNETTVVNACPSKLSNEDDKQQHPIKISFPTQDEPIECDTSDKSDFIGLLNHFETFQERKGTRSLLTDVESQPTSKQNLVKPQESFSKSRCDRVLKLKLSSRDEPKVLTESGQDTNLHTVLDKSHLTTDASIIVDSSVPNTMNYVTKADVGCHSYKQEHILVDKNLENVDRLRTLGYESQYQTKEFATSTEDNVCLQISSDQGYRLGNCGSLNADPQENNKRECSVKDDLKILDIQNKSPSVSDEVALVNGDGPSADDNVMLKVNTSDGVSFVKDDCLWQGIEGQDQTNKNSDIGQPTDKCEQLPHDDLADDDDDDDDGDVPSNVDKGQSLDDLDGVGKCNTYIYGTVDTSECSVKDGLVKINECDHKTVDLAVGEDQCSINNSSGLGKDLQVNTVDEQPLNNGANLNIIIQDNIDNCVHDNASVMPITLDRDGLLIEDPLSVPKNSEHSMDNCFHKVKRDMEGYCVSGNGVGLEMDNRKDKHSSNCPSKSNSNVPLDKGECLLEADVHKHSKDCHVKLDSHLPLDKDECQVRADLGRSLSSRDGEHSVHVDQIVNGDEFDRQIGHSSSVEIAEVEHLKGDNLDVPVSNDEYLMDGNFDKITNDSCESSGTSCIALAEDKTTSSMDERHLMIADDGIKDDEHDSPTSSSVHLEMNQVVHVMEDNFDASVDKDEPHLMNNNKDSSESGYVSHITVDKNEPLVKNDIQVPVSQLPQNFIDNLNIVVDVDADESSNQDGRCESLGNDKETSHLDKDLDLNQTVSHNDEKSSMSDDLGNLIEEGKCMTGNSPGEVHCIFSLDKSCAGEDLAKICAKAKSVVPLLPIGIEHSAHNELFNEITHSNWERTSVCIPRQGRNGLGATVACPLQQLHSSSKVENYMSSEQPSVQASSTNIEACLIQKTSESNMVCEETDEGILEDSSFYNDSSQGIETEDSTTPYGDPVANTGNQTALQMYLEVNQPRVKPTTESRFVSEYSDGRPILYPTTKCQNDSSLDLNVESCRTSEAEAITIGIPVGELYDEDTLSNSSESPKMPFLEVISDLNSSTNQEAARESFCDSDTEMPLLEKFTDSPSSYPEDMRPHTTSSELYEENCELITEPSGNWNCVVQSQEHCAGVSCVDVIPVGSVSNWPYLEEEVFSEAQITGSPQVELPCPGLDDVPSDQRFTSSSDTETEPDSSHVPSTNTALDIVSYKSRDIEKESLTAPSADLKCRLSWKKIFNLAKVEERKKQHRVGEAKNRKEAYRRWPYYGKTGHKRRSLKSPNKLSSSIDKCGKELSSAEMSSNDVDGLVFGPAKIEFRLAPKSQTERWQVVDGSKAMNLCGEENNNVADKSIANTLKPQSPIVLVKRIILKRRGDDNDIPTNVHNVHCSTSMSNSPNSCVNRPISSATLTIPSIHPLNEVNCGSEFSCLTTPPESDDSSTSLKTLERLPKVIIKRTGYGNAKYKSFLRLSAAEGSNWQPFVRLERKKYLDNLAKQLFRQRDLTDKDVGSPSQQPIPLPITLSMSKQLQEINNRSSNEDASMCNVVSTNPNDLTLPESVLSGPVDLHQEHVSKKLCKGAYTAIKKHSKDIKLKFKVFNSNKQCTEVCYTDKKIKQGIVHNRITKSCELDKYQERARKTVKNSARRCSEGGTSRETKTPEYRGRIGSEGANSGSLKPKKRSSNESNNYGVWHTDENKSKFAKTNLEDMESAEPTGDQYNRSPEKAVSKEHKFKKSLKQKLKVITCQACNCSVKNEVEQSAHIRQHPYHCQKCSVAFKSEDDFKSHLSVEHPLTKELHHCLLCKISFPSAKQHQQHLSDRQHQHLDLTQRWTIQTLFKMFTGEGCSRITPLTDSEVTEMSKLTDAEPGAINYYHQATPLQLAVQDLLKQSRKLPNPGVPVSPPIQHQDTNDLM